MRQRMIAVLVATLALAGIVVGGVSIVSPKGTVAHAEATATSETGITAEPTAAPFGTPHPVTEWTGKEKAPGGPSPTPDGAACDWTPLGYWCGKFHSTITLGVGMVHNWSSNPTWNAILGYNQYTDRAPVIPTGPWADTDGFFVGYPYSIKVYPNGGIPEWHNWWGCSTVNGVCKQGYFKKTNLGPGSYYSIQAALKVY